MQLRLQTWGSLGSNLGLGTYSQYKLRQFTYPTSLTYRRWLYVSYRVIVGLNELMHIKRSGLYAAHLSYVDIDITVVSVACVLSHLSLVQRFVTLWTEAHQAPLSMRFSRQEHQSGLPCPSAGISPAQGWTHISYVSCVGRLILYPERHLGSPSLVLYTYIKMKGRTGPVEVYAVDSGKL